MKIKNFLYAALAVASISCSDDFEPVVVDADGNMIIRATIESIDSRAAIDQGKINWSKDDNIAALLNNGKYVELILDDSGIGKATGTFSGTLFGDVALDASENFHAFYPYEVAVGPDEVALPTSYSIGSDFENSHVVMKAVGNGNLVFKHLGGVLRFNLKNVPASTAKVRFTTLDNKNITGNFAVEADGANECIVATAGDGSRSSIEVAFDALDKVSNIEVSIPLPVGEYTGVKLEILDESDQNVVDPVEAPAATNNIRRAARVTLPLTFISVVAGGEDGDISSASVWDGTYVQGATATDRKMPDTFVIDPQAQTITIKDAAAFAYLATYDMNWDVEGYNSYYYKWNWDVLLDCDIDLQNHPWEPLYIGAYRSFDGQGHTISNLNINKPDTKQVALFDKFINVKNLNVENATVVGKEEVAVVVGYAGAATNVHVKNISVTGNKYVGGIAGLLSSAGCINCSVKGANNVITCQTKEVGGIVGFITMDGLSVLSEVKDCYVENTKITGEEEVGGILGRGYCCPQPTTQEETSIAISNCTTQNVEVTATLGLYVGETLGRNYDNKLTVTVDGSRYYNATTTENLTTGLNSADFSTNAIVAVSAGTYGYVEVKNGGNKTNVRVIGAPGATINGIWYQAVHLQAVRNLQIEGLTFAGEDEASVRGLSVSGASSSHVIDGVTVKNCTFNNEGVGVSVAGNTPTDVVSNVTVDGCQFANVDTKGAGPSSVFVQAINNFTVKNCTFTNSCYNAIQANSAPITGDIVIKDNTMVTVKSRNVYLGGIKDGFAGTLTITGNTFCTPTTPKDDGNFVKLGTTTPLQLTGTNYGDMDSSLGTNYYYSGLSFN